jgi:subtilisin family serine protease
VVFFAAGNGNESVDNDGYASYNRVQAVAACNDRTQRSVYSDFGEAIFCTFPSNDFPWAEKGRPEPLTPGIWTTDRTGRAGYSADNYTNSFGGTSSACPGAAGVAALVLSRDGSLRWDAVRDILRRSCERIDPEGGEYDQQGHSPLYGYGRVDAGRAVRSVGVQSRRVHGRRVHGRSTAGDGVVDPTYGANEVRLEDAREVLDLTLSSGTGGQEVNRDLLLATLMAAQAAQIEDLRERVARLEQAG